jgi:hypothetical protein
VVNQEAFTSGQGKIADMRNHARSLEAGLAGWIVKGLKMTKRLLFIVLSFERPQ